MSPAPKRSKRKRQAEAEVEPEAEVTTEPTKRKKGKKGKKAKAEVEAAPTNRRGRAAKDYGVTGEQIAEMRDDGMSWQEIQDEVGAKSAIPLRNMMNKWKAEQDEDEQIDPDDGDAIVAARDEEAMGWGQIAAKTGLTVAQVKKAYVDAGGTHVEQRAYKDKDGNVHFGGSKNGKAEVEDDEAGSEYDDMSRAELRAELTERGLSTKGKNPALIARLVENDAEQEDEEPEPEPEPTPRKAKGKRGAKAGR